MSLRPYLLSFVAALGLWATGCAAHKKTTATPVQQLPSSESSSPILVQTTLIAPGDPPFHLKASITEKGDPDFKANVEIFWMAPDKWRRTIQSPDFSQTLIVERGRVFEQDSDNYFPLGLQTLVIAMVDPQPVLAMLRPGDMLLTKANGASDESGKTCFPNGLKLCGTGRNGLLEMVGAPGHSVDFTNYQNFKSNRVARLLTYHIDPGDSLSAQITELTELEHADQNLFSIEQPTPKERQIHSVVLLQAELQGFALQSADIIWPQVVDGKTTGPSSYYVSVDRSGQVREVLPLQTANERANDSARRQIMKWKFKPAVKDGAPAQAEAILTFTTDTRAYGPPDPLTDAEVRKLASNMVEPSFPAGAPPGATCSERIAIDDEGNLIEAIAGDRTPGLGMVCYEAVKQWHFAPFMENGQPRPYRGEIIFQAPSAAQN